MHTVRRSLGAAAALAAAAIAVSGCGGGGSESETSATVTWADAVCSAITTYKNAVVDAGTTLKNGNLTKAKVNDAVDSVKSATQTFADDLESLDAPETTAGKQAKQTLDELATALEKHASTVEDAIAGSSALNALSVVSSTLLTAQGQVSSAVEELKQLDAKGELSDAFSKAPSCESLSNPK
jgi:hypothetical protein